MKSLAAYIMSGRIQAMGVAMGFTVASMVVPTIFAYFSAATIALVALRHGLKEALLPFIASLVVLSAILWSLDQIVLELRVVYFVLTAVFFGQLLVLAETIRVFRSLSLTMIIAVAMAALSILGFHITVGDTGQWWMSVIQGLDTGAVQQQDVVKKEQFYAEMEQFAPYVTGFVAAAFVMQSLLCLFLARWWQALLYNPGGFGKEFCELQLGRKFAFAIALVVIPALLGMGQLSVIATDIAVAVTVLYLLQGLSVVHVLFQVKKLPAGILYGIYGFVVIFMSPSLFLAAPAIVQYIVILALFLMVQGYLETWVNMRGRLLSRQNNKPQS